MTSAPSTARHGLAASADILDRGGCFEVRWDAILPGRDRRLEAASFVVAVTPVDGEHAQFDAWREDANGVRHVIIRDVVRCTREADGDYLHLDASDDDGPLLQVSWGRGQIYARTRLLRESGQPVAGFDPPSVRLRPAHTDLASA